MLLKEMKEDINNGKTSHVHGWEDFKVGNTTKMIYRVHAILVQIPTAFKKKQK